MAVTYNGRVEARVTVPTGGASVSASNGNGASAATVTLPAANYFMTSAGGVSSLLTTFKTQLDENVQGYSQTAASLANAVGYGTWTAGYLCNEASGGLAAVFGAPTLTATGTPTYGTAGPRGGVDKAVGFDGADGFTGGDVFDVDASSDLCIAWVAKFTSAVTSGNGGMFDKRVTTGWLLQGLTGENIQFNANSGSSFTVTAGAGSQHVGEWHVGIAALDRGAGTMRVGTLGLTSGTSYVSATTDIAALGDTSSTDSFDWGGSSFATAASGLNIAAFYIGTGAGAASGLSANLSTALTNFANAINAEWSVSMSTTDGRVTISNTLPASISFTDTDLRDLLGFEYNFDYPQTAAQMATALGYGTWTSGAGYLCNESSGNLAAVFGTPATLTASGTPTYGNGGPRGGDDKAVGFDSVADAFSGGDALDVAVTDDLIVAWVAWHDSVATGRDLLGKGYAAGGGAPGYLLAIGDLASEAGFYVSDGVDAVRVASSVSAGGWCVGIAVLERASNVVRVGTMPIGGAASVSASTDASAVGTLENANAFLVGDNSIYRAGDTKLAGLYIATGSGVATGLSANLSSALSSFASYMTAQVSTKQAKSVWFPDCPISIEGDPAVAPRVTDLRTSQSPTGYVLGLAGNSYYRHRGVQWTHVPRDRVWETAVTYGNASWQTFADDALYGMGHAWMTPASPLQIYWEDAGTTRAVGYTHSSSTGVAGWSVINVASTEPRKSVEGWTGLFRIELGDIVSTG